jgi:tRNA(adenine34) deaminase
VESQKTTHKTDEFWMEKCLELAKQAAQIKEVPVGAIVVYRDRIVGQAFNRKEIDQKPTAHAEVLAIEEAARNLSRWRLSECTLYVTLEPCIMCAGAINQSRIKRLVYATSDPKAGAIESVFKVFDANLLNHSPLIDTGIYQKEASDLLKSFFGDLRDKKKKSPVASERAPEMSM